MAQRPAGESGAERQRQAAALRYEAGADRAPRVVAKGAGAIAEEILRRARESGVPIHESRELVAALMPFELDQQIPPALYVAIAEVLAWAYQLQPQGSSPASTRVDPAN
jgi:flagellar biosynthesis protein